ncbi:MAG: penicillin-binding transpeptidase domain-containing protein [Muribaculum sp.]|nr:penicillin-binding transpeptidase domain-containing protein [Muribaculum sp.]
MAGRKAGGAGREKPVSGRHVGNFVEIIVTMVFFGALFLCMSVYLVHFVATSEQDMINNSYNTRQEILLSRNYRGTIYSRDGEVLAQTVLDAGQNETRVYPFANLFSHIVGYSTQGRMGVEALANYYLINTNTSINNKVANDMAGVKNPGDNVYTTLDVQIQQTADEQLSVYNGAIIVTEVSTGKVLALVSHPDFDPNEISEIWEELLEDDSSSVLLNRATQGLYPPGSTFKIITALEYVRENPGSWQGYRYQCNGAYRQGDSRISCYHGANHGAVDFESSFAKSCNSSFANIGMKLDREQLQGTLDNLLFDKELPITLLYAKSSVDIPQDITEDAMIQTSIGQGKTQITPMHLNMITCAIANGGKLMKPYVIDHVENDAGNVVKSFKPDAYGFLMTEDESLILRNLMTSVVEEGTATRLKGMEYTAAGKTGSAEYNNVKGDSHAWFTGFAPAENPEVCVTIIVEGAGSGGDYAVPIARRLFDAYFREKPAADQEVAQ